MRSLTRQVTFRVNGELVTAEVSVRCLLSDFLRGSLGLTGTHVGCERGVCGSCTVLVDGEAHRSCLLLTVQVEGRSVATIESIAETSADLNPIQQAFREAHAVQCGFCTPGFIIAASVLLRENANPTDAEIIAGLAGHMCRCTGYQNIVRAVHLAASKMYPQCGS